MLLLSTQTLTKALFIFIEASDTKLAQTINTVKFYIRFLFT